MSSKKMWCECDFKQILDYLSLRNLLSAWCGAVEYYVFKF